MKGTRVQSLVGGQRSHVLWSKEASAPQLQCAGAPEPVWHNCRARVPQREGPRDGAETRHSRINKNYTVMHAYSVTSDVSNSVRPHRRQPIRLPHSWDSPGKNIGVGCRFLLQCMKVKSESEVAQSCPTLSKPMEHSLPGSSVHGIFQARVLEWGANAFSAIGRQGSTILQ